MDAIEISAGISRDIDQYAIIKRNEMRNGVEIPAPMAMLPIAIKCSDCNGAHFVTVNVPNAAPINLFNHPLSIKRQADRPTGVSLNDSDPPCIFAIAATIVRPRP